MANKEHLDLIKQGVEVWNKWRGENTDVIPDLSRAMFMDTKSLRGADLSWANLSRADLSGANLWNANLSRANFSGANLSGADLTLANLTKAKLSDADLRGADLTKAKLSDADLSGANLWNANLSDADLTLADLSDADLRTSHLTVDQLVHAKSLYKAKLLPKIETELREKYPKRYKELIKKPVEPDNETK